MILNIIKHQSLVTGMELNIHVCLGPLLLLLVCPSPSPVHRFSSATMMVQSILENKLVGLSRVAVHDAITKNWEGGGAPDILFQNYQFKRHKSYIFIMQIDSVFLSTEDHGWVHLQSSLVTCVRPCSLLVRLSTIG